MELSEEGTIFVGNPGAGKSTLLNCLAEAPVFASGVSYGCGLTQFAESHRCADGHLLCDTPGLADWQLRQQAAEAITQTLRKGWRRVRLVFVATLSAGRVRGEDAATVKLVLDAVAAHVPVSFGVVFNKLAKEELRDLQTREDLCKAVGEGILKGTERTTAHFHVIEILEELNGKNNAVLPSATAAAFRQFVESIPMKELDPRAVSEVNAETFEELEERFEKEKSTLVAQAEKSERLHEKQLLGLKQTHALEQQAAEKLHEDELATAQRALDEERRKQQLQLDAAKREQEAQMTALEKVKREREALAKKDAELQAAREHEERNAQRFPDPVEQSHDQHTPPLINPHQARSEQLREEIEQTRAKMAEMDNQIAALQAQLQYMRTRHPEVQLVYVVDGRCSPRERQSACVIA
jgi:GTP-binding protein EngB required for normal cell division